MVKTKKIENTRKSFNWSEVREFSADKKFSGKNLLFICLILSITVVVFLPSINGEFCYDDQKFVVANTFGEEGFISHIPDVFSSIIFGNYQPVTMLSYDIDKAIYGAGPIGYHITNILLHLLAVYMVMLLIFRLTGKFKIAVIAGGLFALHPLHVESVAWISGRKDILLTIFMILSILFYLKYLANNNEKKYYIFSLIFFVFTVLSKGTAIVLPVLLLLIDLWAGNKNKKQVLINKVPFAIISLIIIYISFVGQQNLGAMDSSVEYSVIDRLQLASYSLLFYIYKMFIPTGLSINYAFPVKDGGMFPAIFVAAPFIVLLLGGILIKSFRKKTYILVPVLFYVIAISPLIQIIPFSGSITADRFFYMPSIGLFLLAGIVFCRAYTGKFKEIIIIVSGIIIGILGYLSFERSKAWESPLTLCTEALKVNPDWPIAYNDIGVYYYEHNEPAKAVGYLIRALKLNKRYYQAHYHLGLAFYADNNLKQAEKAFRNSLKLKPGYTYAMIEMGKLLVETNRPGEAIEYLNKYLNVFNENVEAINYLGEAYLALDQNKKAFDNFTKAYGIDSADYSTLNNLGRYYIKEYQLEKAEGYLNKAIDKNPDEADAFESFGKLYQMKADTLKALEFFRKADSIKNIDANKSVK